MRNDLAKKVAYVKRAVQTRDHACHWPGCTVQVPPAKWGCTKHWFWLPKEIRDRIWRAFRPGQEVSLTPSPEYLAAAKAAQDYIREWNARANPQRSLNLGE